MSSCVSSSSDACVVVVMSASVMRQLQASSLTTDATATATPTRSGRDYTTTAAITDRTHSTTSNATLLSHYYAILQSATATLTKLHSTCLNDAILQCSTNNQLTCVTPCLSILNLLSTQLPLEIA
jgi:hypothetical protein